MYGINSYFKKQSLPSEYLCIFVVINLLLLLRLYKYLGVTLDSTLSFNIHVVSISKKANSVLLFIRKNLAECHRKVKIYAYNYFVKPIFCLDSS